MRNRRLQVAVVMVLVIVLALALPIPSSYSHAAGDAVAPVFVSDAFGTPADWMSALVVCAGGLPRRAGVYVTTAETASFQTICLAKSAEPIQLWQVSGWDVVRTSVRGSWGPLLEYVPVPFVNLGGNQHAPSYTVRAEFRVRYTDGETRLLRWDTWRWGVTLGPLAWDTGHGPTGDVTVLE